ncbi:Transcription factor TFIIIB component B'', partial [Fusarium oxysporum f. sp. albedinis]
MLKTSIHYVSARVLSAKFLHAPLFFQTYSCALHLSRQVEEPTSNQPP